MLSDKEQKSLIYRRKLQFDSGNVAKELVATSAANKLMDKKRKFTESVRGTQLATVKGFLQLTMMGHFRDHCNQKSF